MKPKKSLGQHFLTSKKVVSEIIAAANLTPTDTVLEVGPGKGILTEALLEKAGKVIAVEKDALLVNFLKEKFATRPNLKIIEGDILDFLPEGSPRGEKGFKIVANLPYYITGHFLRFALESSRPPELMVLMVQKEVAERIVARDGRESLLSISVKKYATPRYIKKVPARYFSPKPKVDSAIITLTSCETELRSSVSQKSSVINMDLVKKGFAHKRKLLSTNLSIGPEILKKCGIPEKARAENLSTDDWSKLSDIIR